MSSPTPNVPTFGRRELLGSMGIAAGTALLHETIPAAANPAANVADRGSSIRITDLKPTICGDRVYIKIETNHNVTGWGEIKGVIPSVAKTLVMAMFELLDGQNPTRIEHLWQVLYRSHRNHRGGPFMLHCISGIDMALWDITGKLWGVPVYRLLGGPTRDKIRVYPTDKAVKLGTGPKRHSSNPQTIDQLVASVRSARERVGPDGAVMFDAHSALPPATLMQFASAVEPYDLLFLEEPVVPGNIDTFKKIRQAVKIPLATGERDRTIWGILPYLKEQIVDVVQPDSGYTGGISQSKKIATLAEAWYVPIAPHNTQSYLGMTASFHVAASVPLFLIHESYDDEVLGRIVRYNWSKDADGYASLPEGTGLCVDIDEQALAEVAADPPQRFKWQHHRLPDGSVADY
ncbi:MAG: mandelate racemase/muconate lactonizing enzyme family protein [Pirellulales bacterium]